METDFLFVELVGSQLYIGLKLGYANACLIKNRVVDNCLDS